MARGQEPMSEEEFEAGMAAQRERLHEALAEDLGGYPEDYGANARTVLAGGNE